MDYGVDLDNAVLKFDVSDERYRRRLKRKVCDYEIDELRGRSKTSLNDDRVFGDDSDGNVKKCLKNDGVFDSDYFVFLTYLLGKTCCENEEDEEEEEADPHIMMFLKNLRPDGKSYVLRSKRGGGVLKFEGMYDSDEEIEPCDKEIQLNSMKQIRRGKVERRKDLVISRRGSSERFSRKEKRDTRVHVRHDSGNSNRKCNLGVPQKDDGKNMSSTLEKDGRNSVAEQSLRSDDKHGPRIHGKLRNVTENEKIKNNVMSIQGNSVREEKNSTSEDECDQEWRNLRSVTKSKKTEGREKNVKSKVGEENGKSFMHKERYLRSDNVSNVSHETRGCLRENFSPLNNHNRHGKCPNDNDDLDSCFKLFLDHCHVEGNSFVLVYNGKRIKYEEDDDLSSSDSDLLVLDGAPNCMKWTPGVNSRSEEDDLQYLGTFSKVENPQFRKEVMDILRKPYNEEEYKSLWQHVNLQKPTEGHIELRGRTKSFPKSTMGKSYLDYYSDLKRQLDAFNNDKPRKLNVLRGFFCYLKSMSQDGVFKPWLDKLCLAVVPEVTR